MDGNKIHRSARVRKVACLAAAMLLTAPAGGPALAEASADADFGASFTQFAQPAVKAIPAPGAVDVTTIVPVAEPEDGVARSLGEGTASYYGRKFNGRPTASGERFDMNGLTAAHRTLPFGSRVRVTNSSNGRSVIVRINDRGPYSGHRLIDLSRAAAEQIGLVGAGHGRVSLELLEG
jgi:rare lipoprotein A